MFPGATGGLRKKPSADFFRAFSEHGQEEIVMARIADQISSLLLKASLAGHACLTKQTPSHRIRALVEALRPATPEAPLIRIGPDGDGGYLVPDLLSGITACFSPGVSTQSGFELECAERGMDLFLADGSVATPPVDHHRFHFIQKHIGLVDDAHTMTLDTWISNAGVDPTADLLLQMDIEGFEYPAIASLSTGRLEQFRFLVVEFHRLYLVWSSPYFELMEGVFRKLLQTHACVHIHPNNVAPSFSRDGITVPAVMEFTFARRKDVLLTGGTGRFPHALDRQNSPSVPDKVLPLCWQR